jgi:hypothetical protein
MNGEQHKKLIDLLPEDGAPPNGIKNIAEKVRENGKQYSRREIENIYGGIRTVEIKEIQKRYLDCC